MKWLVACSLVLLFALGNCRPSLTQDDNDGLRLLRAFADSLNEDTEVAAEDVISLAKDYAEDTTNIVNDFSDQIKSDNDNRTHIIFQTVNFINVAIGTTAKLVQNIMGRNLLHVSVHKNVQQPPLADLIPPSPLTIKQLGATPEKMKTICSILAELNQQFSIPLVPVLPIGPSQKKSSTKLINIPIVTEANLPILNTAYKTDIPFGLDDKLPKVLIPESLSKAPITIATKSTTSIGHRTNPPTNTIASTTTRQTTTTNKASTASSTDSTEITAKALIIGPTTTITKTTSDDDDPIITITRSAHVNQDFNSMRKESLTPKYQEKTFPLEIQIAQTELTQANQYLKQAIIDTNESTKKGAESVVPYIAVPAVSLNKEENPGLLMEIVQVPKVAITDMQTPIFSSPEDLSIESPSQEKISGDLLLREVYSTEIPDQKHDTIEIETVVLNEVSPSISLPLLPPAVPQTPKVLIPKLAPLPAPVITISPLPAPAPLSGPALTLETLPIPVAESAPSPAEDIKQVLVAKIEGAVRVDQEGEKKEFVLHTIVDKSPVTGVIDVAIPNLREINTVYNTYDAASADSLLKTTIPSEINLSPSRRIDDNSPVMQEYQVVSLTTSTNDSDEKDSSNI